ncbi:hypothetical protein JW968_02935 [Candidatus Woesearchaeota archaeon]|nr:hypothetical protein [Candidatus Woesearchaeota archaeon]
MEATATIGSGIDFGSIARLLSFKRNRPDYSRWTIDQMIASPKFARIKEIYRATKKRKDLHTLEDTIGNYQEFFANEILASINEMPMDDPRIKRVVAYLNGLSGRELARLPRFEVPLDRMTGKGLNQRGANIISYIIVPLGHTDPETGRDYMIVQSFVNKYNDEKEHAQAHACAGFYHEIHGMASATEAGERFLSRTKSLKPRYSSQGIISDTFLHEEDGLRASGGMTDQQKVDWVRDKVRMDTVMSYEMTRAASGGPEALQRDVISLIYEKMMGRANPDADPESISRMRAFYEPTQRLVVHGDNNPANVMLGQDDSGMIYTQRDFELMGTGSLALQTMQLMSKLNLYDHNGNPVETEQGVSEDQIKNAQLEAIQAAGVDYPQSDFDRDFDRAKIFEHLTWAVRYRHHAGLEKIVNGYDARDISNYYYTLAVKEIARQKQRAAGAELEKLIQHEADVTESIGYAHAELDEAMMQDIHTRLHPQTTLLSFLKISDEKEKLGRKLRGYSGGKSKMGVAAACLSAALLLSACAYYGNSLLNKAPAALPATMPAPARTGVPAEGAPAQESIDLEKRLRFYTAMSIKEIRQTLKYNQLFHKYHDNGYSDSDEFALAEFYDGNALQRAVEATQPERRKSWASVSGNLPPDIRILVDYWQDDEIQHKFVYGTPGEVPIHTQEAIDADNKKWDEQFGQGVRNKDLEMLFADFDVYHGVKDLFRDIKQEVLQDIAEDLLVTLKTKYSYNMSGVPDLWMLPASLRDFFSRSGIDWDKLAEEMKGSSNYEEWMNYIIREDGWKRFIDQERYQAFKEGRTMHDVSGKDLCALSEQYDREHWQDVLKTNFQHLMYSHSNSYNGSRYSYSWRLENTGDARIAALGMIDEGFYKQFMDMYSEVTGNPNPDYADVYSFLPKSVRFLFENVDFRWEDVMEKKEKDDPDFLGLQRLGQGTGQWETVIKSNNSNNTYARSYKKMAREFTEQNPDIVSPPDSRSGWRDTQQMHDQQYQVAMRQNMPR